MTAAKRHVTGNFGKREGIKSTMRARERMTRNWKISQRLSLGRERPVIENTGRGKIKVVSAASLADSQLKFSVIDFLVLAKIFFFVNRLQLHEYV